MSRRIWKDRVQDILDVVHETAAFLAGMDYESFCKDAKTVKAVTANLTIIGEAARHVPDDVVQSHPELPWPLMRGMRNRIVHSYFQVDLRIVWDTCQQDLPTLVEPLQRLLESEEEER